jgi:transcription elongation factor GreA
MKDSKKNYITREWYNKLVAELKELREVKLPDILEKLAEAKAQWDLSENFEYKSAMEDKDFVNSKIAELEKLLANAEIIEEETTWTWKGGIWYWSKVSLQIEWDKDTYTVTIVWTWEVKINDGSKDDLFISLDSPIWSAIKWHKAWDEVKMRLWNERKNIKILEVK